jgi:CubicO group peptidase (beta-lactamase class C family)
MKRPALFLFILILAVSIGFADGAAIRQQPDVAANIDLLDKWIRAQMEYRDLPGLAVAVVYDQDLVWSGYYGYADLEAKKPVTAQTVFRIASITKTFTSTAIMILRDRGKLQLDDPVAKYLSWFTYKNRYPDGPAVTIRHLLTHTSGLPREAAFPYWTDNNFPSREEMVEAFHNQESVFEPETKLKYSNLGMAILGEIVAVAGGEPFDRFIQKNILDPLEMNSTSVIPAGEIRNRIAVGYNRRMPDGSRKRTPFFDSKGLTSAANIASTAEDLARYASAHMRQGPVGGKQILKTSSLREMHRVQWLNPGWGSGWGLGFSVSKSGDRVTFGHGGWAGSHTSNLAVSPDEKVAVVVMTNSDDGVPSFFASRILTMLAPAIKKSLPAPAPAAPPDTAAWKKYVGRYSDPDGGITDVMVFNGKLMMVGFNYPPEENPVGALTELTPEGDNTFRTTGENGNGEPVVFEMGTDGRVKRVKATENYLFPVQ